MSKINNLSLLGKRDENAVDYVISRAQLLVISRNINTINETKESITKSIKEFNNATKKYLVEQLNMLENDKDSVYIRAITNGDVAEILKSFVLTDSKCAKIYNDLQENKNKNKKMGLIKRYVFVENAKQKIIDLSKLNYVSKQNYNASVEDMLATQSINMRYLTTAKKFLDYMAMGDTKAIQKFLEECVVFDKVNNTELSNLATKVLYNKAEILENLKDIRRNCIAADECVPLD